MGIALFVIENGPLLDRFLGDGQIDGDEGTAALDAFTRSIGRTQRRKL